MCVCAINLDSSSVIHMVEPVTWAKLVGDWNYGLGK